MNDRPLPGSFLLGTSTSAYQIEGAWDQDGKGESVWDRFTHSRRVIKDGTDGDRACDHYHRVDEDVRILDALGVDAYRFSVSWPRVIPEGSGAASAAGLSFYDRLVDRLCTLGVEPFVTLFHWDTPQALEERGGWTNRAIAGWFAEYADRIARLLSDRVTHWITLNEPISVAGAGYLAGVHAPGRRSPIAAARAVHFQLLAHAHATDAIRAVTPSARIGIANSFAPVYPLRPRDSRVAARVSAVLNELFMDPLYFGSYPGAVGPVLALLNRGIRSGDWDLINRPPDFVGVNHYSRYLAKRTIIPFVGVRFLRPADRIDLTDIEWEIHPPGFRSILGWIRDRYGNPPLYITENGASFDEPVRDGRVDDIRRISYLHGYLTQMQAAIEDGSDIRGYFVWSLLDNFEWAYGFSQRFGLVHVDYDTLERLPKESFRYYADVCRTRDPHRSFIAQVDRTPTDRSRTDS